MIKLAGLKGDNVWNVLSASRARKLACVLAVDLSPARTDPLRILRHSFTACEGHLDLVHYLAERGTCQTCRNLSVHGLALVTNLVSEIALITVFDSARRGLSKDRTGVSRLRANNAETR